MIVRRIGLFTEAGPSLGVRRVCKLVTAVLILALAANTIAQTDTQADATDGAETDAETTAAAEPKPVTPPPYKSTEERDMKLLAERLAPDAAIWLNSSSEEFLAIYEPDHTGSPFGVLLIIHDEGQHATWPHNIETIRLALPQYGWGTLTLSLPLPDYPKLPEREPPSTPPAPAPSEDGEDTNPPGAEDIDETKDIYNAETGEVDNVDAVSSTPSQEPQETPEPQPDPAEQRAQERISAAIKWLNEQGQYNLAILGDGIGATRASQYVASENARNAGTNNINIIRGMIMLNPQHNVPQGELSLLEFFEQSPMPTLDIYFGYERYDQEAARMRKQLARRAKFETYQQFHLPRTTAQPKINTYSPSNSQRGVNRLTQRIRGFLQKYARGVAVDNARIQNR